MVEWSGILVPIGFVLLLDRGMRGLVWIALAQFAMLVTSRDPIGLVLAEFAADYAVIGVAVALARRVTTGRRDAPWRANFTVLSVAFLLGSVSGGVVFVLLSAASGQVLPHGYSFEAETIDVLTRVSHFFFGLLIVVPVLLLSASAVPRGIRSSFREQGGELIAWSATTLLSLGGLFSGVLSFETVASVRSGREFDEYFPLAFMLSPTVVWSAVRFSRSLHSVCLLLVLLAFYVGADLGLGPFKILPLEYRQLYVALYGAVFGFLGHLINGVAWEGRSVALRLEDDVRRRNREVQNSEKLLSSVIENIPDMIIVKDARTLEWVRVNRAVEELLGKERGWIAGKKDADLIDAESAALNLKRDRDVIRNADSFSDRPGLHRMAIESSEGYCCRNHREPGLKRIFRTTRVPLVGEAGTTEYLVVISEDITEMRRSEEDRLRLAEESAARREAEKLLELRDSFMSLAAHELRTPISVIRLSIEIAQRTIHSAVPRGPEDQARLDQLFRQSLHEVDRLGRLVENLMDVSRIQSERFEVNPVSGVDLSALLQGAVDLVRPLFEQARSRLDARIQPGILAEVDADRIRQIFQNLLTNASKFGRGKSVEVELFIEGEDWVARVRDHGIGISTEAAARLFERFERGVSYREFPGLGLGLYISSRIAQAHGGGIVVESRPGEGATFTVRAPLHRSSSTAA